MGEDAMLDKFIEELLADKDLSGVTEVARGYLVNDLKSRLIDQINRSLINELSEEKLEEFTSLLDSDQITADQIQRFVSDCGVDVPKVVARTALAFRGLYLQTPSERSTNSGQ